MSLIGEFYFDHKLQLFAISEASPTENLGREDGELVEQFFKQRSIRGPKFGLPRVESCI